MARPHLEHLHTPELPWQPLAWTGWPAGASVKELSRDEGTGAVSSLVRLPAGWRRPAGHHPADAEVLVTSGTLRIGDDELGPSSFDWAPPGASQEPWEASAETELLFMTRTGPPDLVAGGGNEGERRIRLRGDELPYGENPVADGPPKIEVAVLRLVEGTGEMTALVKGTGSAEYPVFEFHDCVEECYLIEGGSITLENSGTMVPGTYFWRPPYITHGRSTIRDDTLLYVYVDSELINHRTDRLESTPEENRRRVGVS